MDEIHMKEERTIKSWTKRKNALDECYQYVIFEKSSKEALAWLHQSEQCYVSKFQQTLASNNRDEIKRLYKEFAEFADQVRTQQEYVNVLIELSPKLLESSSSRFAANIAAWANKVETRYKEFFSLMAKVQQQHGLGGSGAINNNAAAPNAGSLNSSMNSLSSQVSAVCASPSLSSNQSSFLTLTSTSSNNVESSKTLLSSSTSEQTPVISNNKSTIETNKSKQEIFKQNEQKQKLIKKRRNIITEIIQTEKSYVQDLCACLDTYYKEFLSNANSLPEYLKGKETVVFGNLEEIYNFHKKTFLVELENYENMPEDIGHCFVIYADQFQIYVEYCKNKENSTKLLMEDSRNENFFEKIQRNGQLKCSLDSYLIKPIQRITKYQLLLKDLLTCCEETSETRSETRDALDVMMSVPKKANDAIHLSLLEGLDVDGLSKEALGDVLLQDRFFVWDSKQIIKKGKERHVFLFETSLVFAKEVKDVRGKLKYVYKFKLMTSEVNITEHMEGDACKLAVWTGRAPLSDHRVVLKSPSLEVKQAWVKKIRELIQEKYFYMEVAMCEAASSGGNGGNRSNRNSNNFELLDQNGHDLNTNSSSIHTNSMMIENFSSAASNASSGTKASSEITTLQSDYVTSDNVHLFKGQHVQIVQRLNNDLCLVQLLNNLELSSPTSTMSSVNSKQQQQPQPSTPQQSQQVIEVQIPISLVKSRSSNRAHINFDDDVEDTTTSGGGGGGKSVGSTKRKGSFKKWLRSSHRKLTSNASNNSSSSSMTARKEIINGGSGAKLLLGSSDSENLKIKKVLSNSEDLKIKNWLIEEPNNEENEANHLSEQTILENPTAASTTIPSSSSNASTTTTTPNRQISQQQHQQENQPTTPVVQQTSNGNDQEDQEDTSFIPPPMNVIKPEQSEQNSTSGSFNKIPNQSIDIQKELKLWQSKMENSKKQLGASGSGSDQQQQQQQVDSSQAPTQLSPNPTPSMAETKLTYAIKELLTTERDYVTDLSNLIDKFMEGIKRNEIPMPQDMVGKEMIVFGNVQQIYEWHKSTFFPDLEKCLSEPPNYIAQLFIKYENRFQMYVKYCENKPKSEFIVSEYDTYFEELRQKLNQKLNIQDLLIKPIQRIMKYQLMLKEIRKFMDKEHMDCRLMDRAIEITITVPKNADDMMNLGRLQGFEGRITAQGRLLLQDTLLVHDSTSDEQKPTKKNAKSSSSESGGGDKQVNKFKERRVFLFQQIIIFSEMVGPANPKSKFTSPKYIFKCDMKVNKLKLEKDDAQLTFTLLDKTPDITPRKIVCLCEDAAKYNNWINQLQDLLDMQNQFLRDLQNPQAAIQKIGSAGSSGSMSSPISSGGGGGKANHHHKDKDQQHPSSASSSSASSSHHHGIVGQVNDFFKSAFTFSSSSSSNSSGTTAGATSPPLNQQPMSPGVLNNTNHSNRSSGTSIATTPTTISPSLAKQASSGSGGRSNTSLNTASTTTNDHLSSELAQQLTINNTTTSTNSDSRKNSGSGNGNGNGNTAPGIVLAKCIVSYTAVTEDEISVQKGDVVQIMMANMHNRYMVHREADGQQPAAEGWIPGSVIGSQFSSSSLSSSSSSTAANPISSPPQQLI